MEKLHWLLIEKNNEQNGVLPAADPATYAKLFKPSMMSPSQIYYLFNLQEQCSEVTKPKK